jgi:hypothetical protein
MHEQLKHCWLKPDAPKPPGDQGGKARDDAVERLKAATRKADEQARRRRRPGRRGATSEDA